MSVRRRLESYSKNIKPKREKYKNNLRCIDCGIASGTYRCKSCRKRSAEYAKKWRSKNKEKVLESQKEWRKHNRHKIKLSNKKANVKQYGMTIEEYDEAIKKPCQICGTLEKRKAIDHCHITNIVRGTLCFSCNTKLGWFEKYNTSIINYLKGRQ